MVMDALSRLLVKAREGGFISSFSVGGRKLSISGLKVNLDKSEIIPMGRIDNLEELAAELDCKWGWRFISKRDSLWRPMIVGKFGEESGGWTSRVLREGYGVGFGKPSRNIGRFLIAKFAFIIRNERRIKFWLHKWCGDNSLKESSPPYFPSLIQRMPRLWIRGMKKGS
ncbi:hypothetical protein CK203_078530 [Vitis vinifera]|uniref:Uncharacterized protein n=1 Tax=Vitis vinifera TaxID=29760 RepID=A0A438FA48_VITVI|nr:hypothetical protein CK203_078530 [Vitis vinifera]